MRDKVELRKEKEKRDHESVLFYTSINCKLGVAVRTERGSGGTWLVTDD